MRFLLVDTLNLSARPIIKDISERAVCDIARTLEECSFFLECNEYDAFILFGKLGGGNYSQICADTRKIKNGIIIMCISDCPSCREKISLLASGADVYLPSDTEVEEIFAELAVFVRRYNTERSNDPITFCGFSLSIFKRLLRYGRHTIPLRKKEYDLAEYLFINAGKILSKEIILDHVWDQGLEVASNTLEVHIAALRNKFRTYSKKKIIETKRGFGYTIPA